MSDEIRFAAANKEKIEDLKRELRDAFSETRPPAGGEIVEHECDECRGIERDFAGVRRPEAPAELIEKNYDKLPLFSAAAFHYFLPAYLLYALEHFDDEFSDVPQFTLYALTPGKTWKDPDGQISSWWIERFRAFTPAQMNLIYRFLELARENPIYRNEIRSIERAFGRLKKIKPF
jgi:hypothetical protein